MSQKISQSQFDEMYANHIQYMKVRSSDNKDELDPNNQNWRLRLDLQNKDLRKIDLRNKNLSFAKLHYTDMRGCDLSGSVFRFAGMRFCMLSNADFSHANIITAIMDGSNIQGTKFPAQTHMPLEGSFKAYKWAYDAENKCVIMEIEVPEKAKRIACVTSKNCRAEFIRVLGVHPYSRKPVGKELKSWRDLHYTYSISKNNVLYYPKGGLNTDILIDDCPGMHFVMTFKEANVF